MNEAQIENLLRKAPRVNIPDGLVGKLRGDIRLPRESPSKCIKSENWLWLKRWIPVTICLVFGLGAVAVQIKTHSRLKQEKDALQSAAKNLEQLRNENAKYKKLLLISGDLERLRKESRELSDLRAEISRLRTETSGIEKLRAENKQLESDAAANIGTNKDFFAEAQARAERIRCVNNLKQIGLAARIWAGDHKDLYPSNFISMKNELGTPKILKCPSDRSRTETTSWAELTAGNVSYQMDAPGVTWNDPRVVFVECPIHHNFCLLDGSVQQLNEEGMKKHLKVINGQKVLE